jgi:protein phosphatase
MAMPGYNEDTAEFLAGEPFAERFFDPLQPQLKVEFGAATHQGKVRLNNEDHYAVFHRRRTSELLLSNLSAAELVFSDDSAYGMVVADGMGGAQFGEFASRLALQRMFELTGQATSWVMKLTDFDAQQIRERVSAYVQKIQATLREHEEAEPALRGMGTTWTSAYLMPPQALVVHIGDSRAYVLHEGSICQVTHDETVAQALIDTGSDPKDVSRFRHMLLNNFGGDADDVTAQIHQLHFGAGTRLLLCTDGLTDLVADEAIARIIEESASPQAACDALVQAALDNGGRDNVTVVLATAR